MNALPASLAQQAGLRAIHLEVDKTNEQARRLYERMGFRERENYVIMSKRL